MKLALAQLNPLIGDIAGNLAAAQRAAQQARSAGADLVIFAEQTLLGYPAKDLWLRAEAIRENVAALDEFAKSLSGIAAIIGFAEPNTGVHGRPVFNAAALCDGGRVMQVWRKRLLPTYDVFDESRYFQPAGPQPVVNFRGTRLAVTICEDLLHEPLAGRSLYDCDPVADVARAGAELIINISASPYWLGKLAWRRERASADARKLRVPIVLVNQVGGNDELVFDGGSFVVGANGATLAQARAFAEDLLIVDLARPADARRESVPSGMAEMHAALVLGVRDYARKCGFRKAVLGLSGGIDSAVTACLAVSALGAENVHGVALPSRFSSPHSIDDAREVARRLGIRFSTIPIEPAHLAYEQMLAPSFVGRAADVAEENVQSRIRGATLMALSNKFGDLLLTTGNKSEIAVGYCTLYGDMCGGLAVISDVPKTKVYELARYINSQAAAALNHASNPIPESSLTKAPSAELRPNQTDQDSLPPYDILDAILERYEEAGESAAEIIAAGFDEATVRRVIRLIHVSEYKRKQAAPGLKVTSRAFGFGRRMPIAAKMPSISSCAERP